MMPAILGWLMTFSTGSSSSAGKMGTEGDRVPDFLWYATDVDSSGVMLDISGEGGSNAIPAALLQGVRLREELSNGGVE